MTYLQSLGVRAVVVEVHEEAAWREVVDGHVAVRWRPGFADGYPAEDRRQITGVDVAAVKAIQEADGACMGDFRAEWATDHQVALNLLLSVDSHLLVLTDVSSGTHVDAGKAP